MKTYKSYLFRDKDPVIDQVRTAIEDSGVKWAFIEHKSGVTTQTLHNWFSGPTKRPQHATVRAVLRAIGYDFALVKTAAVVESIESNVLPLKLKRKIARG